VLAKLEVIALHQADAEAAQEGGADRLEVVGTMEYGGLSPEPRLVSAIHRMTNLPLRVMLRLSDGFSTTGGELTRLIGLAEDYLAVGAEGLVFGFLDADLEVDQEVTSALCEVITGVPWTFHRAIDHALDHRRAWRQVRRLPGLDAVLTAGSVLGVEAGLDDLTARAAEDPVVAALTMAGGGLAPEHVPWLTRAGIRQFHVGSGVRPGGSWTKAHVDAGYVRSWRTLIDDAVTHLAG
jgi:copper homeostasis protein